MTKIERVHRALRAAGLVDSDSAAEDRRKAAEHWNALEDSADHEPAFYQASTMGMMPEGCTHNLVPVRTWPLSMAGYKEKMESALSAAGLPYTISATGRIFV